MTDTYEAGGTRVRGACDVWLAVLFFAGVAPLCVACDENWASSSQSSPPEPSEPRVTAPALIAAYIENEVAADRQYKGETIIVTGTVERIGKSVWGDLVVLLGPSDAMRSVHCFFADEYEDTLAQLSPGDLLTVRGECDGLFMDILLRDCEIVGSGRG